MIVIIVANGQCADEIRIGQVATDTVVAEVVRFPIGIPAGVNETSCGTLANIVVAHRVRYTRLPV